MDLEDINPMSMVAGIVSGVLGVFTAGSMMPESFLMKIIVFVCCTVAGYAIFEGILNR